MRYILILLLITGCCSIDLTEYEVVEDKLCSGCEDFVYESDLAAMCMPNCVKAFRFKKIVNQSKEE